MSEFWNTRYAAEEYVYGEKPNAYFKDMIDGLPPGRVLVPGAGEGRDAVYAATLGWQVVAFDLSSEGRRKALQLASRHQVHIDYHIMDVAEFVREMQPSDGDMQHAEANNAHADIEIAGKETSLSAEESHLQPGYRTSLDPRHNTYDLIAMVFLHLPHSLRRAFHRRMVQQLNPGGMLIMEAFAPGQLNYESGGPKDPDLLYAPSTIENDFEGLRILESYELVAEMNEGPFHQGPASVMRFRGVK